MVKAVFRYHRRIDCARRRFVKAEQILHSSGRISVPGIRQKNQGKKTEKIYSTV
jgi:hypothetical protein